MDLKRISDSRKELMGLALLWIFCFHVWEPVFERVDFLFLDKIEWYIKKTGYCGVEIFLFLSGMGLVYAIHKQNLKTFYKRRLMRIYPSFVIWFTLSTLLRTDKMSFPDYIKRITFYANWTDSLLVYKWFVAAIIMLYLWFPLYYCILKRCKWPVAFTIVLIVIEFCSSVVFYDRIRDDLFLIVDRLPIFILGILAGHLCVEMPDHKFMKQTLKKKQWIAILVCGCVFIPGNFVLHSMEVTPLMYNVRNLLNTCIAVLICVGCAKLLENFNGNKIIQKMRLLLSSIGTYSFEFYLTHELISLKVKSYDLHIISINVVNQITIFIICFIVSIISAWVVKKILEYGQTFTKCGFRRLTNHPKFHIL